ncbi:MAG: transglutaminase domain-containing protein [Pirellulaceae bacterium]|nr:transglutaminase domain-containing protein [Pirellulaceae bacterium]
MLTRFMAGSLAAMTAGESFGQESIDAATGNLSSTGATPNDSTAPRIVYDSPQTQHWRIGLVLDTPVTCTNVFATFPVPMNWPEQKVNLISQNVDRRITAWKVRDVAKGAKQVVLQMPRITAGSNAELTLTLQVERSRILAPTRTDDLVIPKRIDRELRVFTGPSPHIDSTNPRIKAVSKELATKDAACDWDRVEQIYDYVRANVEYVEGPLKNASVALRDGKGDCEEMTSLVVALCRNARIPARMVWIPDHCYPEFYLEDGEGNGHWFPCQAAGTRQFGRMDEYRPVLQKGDRFKVPEKRTPVRYVAEFFKCDRQGKGTPRPKFIREMIEV